MASTHSPIGTISPLCSAIGTNRAGEIIPCVGCTQRSSASVPNMCAVREPDLGLVVQLELAARERVAKAGLELEPLDGARAQRLVEDLQPRLALLLGLVHGGVGVADQVVGADRVALGQRDAEAGADEAVLALELERLADRGGEPVGDAADVVEVLDALEQDHELVAAEAGDHVVGAQLVGEALGDGDQQLVTGAVAERVVDDLEVVDVGEHHGDLAAQLGLALDRRGQHAVEQRAVRQVRQRVVVGLEVEPLGVALAGRDVDAL